MSAAEEPTSTPKPPAPKWGDPISAERQAELQGILDAWDAEADHGYKKGPFAGVSLTGDEVFWLAERSERDHLGFVPDLHLERASLDNAHLEGAGLYQAHLEGADLRRAHLEGASLGGAHLEGALLRDAHLEGATLQVAHLEGAILGDAHLETLYVNTL